MPYELEKHGSLVEHGVVYNVKFSSHDEVIYSTSNQETICYHSPNE